ncbi:MAG: HNH endonuclease [Candidatus Sericytochromatia bacterium]
MVISNDGFFSFSENYEIIIDYTIKEKMFSLQSKTEIVTQNITTKQGTEGVRNKYTLGKVPKKSKKVCRFCNRNSDEVSFKDETHAIPHLLGNNILFSDYECFDCNHKFGEELENDLGKFLGDINRILGNLKGKSGVPKYKSKDKKSIIQRDGNVLITVANIVDSPDEKEKYYFDNNVMELFGEKQSYKPIAVYKCLVKIFLTLLPQEEMFFKNNNFFKSTIEWINEEHRDYDMVLPLFYRNDFNLIGEPLRAIILKRKSEESLLPYMLFVLSFNNTFIQIMIPENEGNTNLVGKTANFPLYPLYSDKIIGMKAEYYDFSSSQMIREEKHGSTIINKGEVIDINKNDIPIELTNQLKKIIDMSEKEKLAFIKSFIKLT